jgi:hypothetical protein
MKKNNFKLYQNSIELLNSEGPILKAVKIRGYFVIIDEDQEQIDVLTDLEMLRFVEGYRSIQDSRGRIWNYLKVDPGMRENKNVIVSFVGLHYEIESLKVYESYRKKFGEIDLETIENVVSVLTENPSLIIKR